MRTLKSTKREAVRQEERPLFLVFVLRRKHYYLFIYIFFLPGGRALKNRPKLPSEEERIKKSQKTTKGEMKKKMSCHKSRRKLVMWFGLLEAPAFLFARQYRQQRSLQGYNRTPSRNEGQRERGICIRDRWCAVESTPAHLYSTPVYDIPGPVLLPGIQ